MRCDKNPVPDVNSGLGDVGAPSITPGAMSEPQQRSRWKHFRASLSRQSRGRSKDTIAIIVLALAGVAMTLFIFTQQKASLPSWAPFVGEEFVHITGEFETAQAVAPGQGQAVDIAGIQVGKITSVALEDGHAVVGMDIEPKYMELIHPDATLLMRPKTNLNDMVVEVTPGRLRGTSKRATTSRWPRPNRTPTSTPSSRPWTPTRASTSSCCSPAAPKGSAAATSSRAPSAASSPSSTTSPTSTKPSPSAASRWPG